MKPSGRLGVLIFVLAEITCTSVSQSQDEKSKIELEAQRPPSTSYIPKHLDRIDQRHLPRDGVYAPPSIGLGVTLYILDTGVRVTHDAFGGRARFVDNGQKGDFVGDDHGSAFGAVDQHGHGTHLAGVAAGLEFGVAPGADIRVLRVSDGRRMSATSVLVDAVNWLTANAERPAVALVSINIEDDPIVRNAVVRSVESGITYIAAAGNTPRNACNTGLTGIDGVIAVAASTNEDQNATFSAYGPCVDLFAPGDMIRSASHLGDSRTVSKSGSSAASAVVAGAAALYLELFPGASPCDVRAFLLNNATWDALTLEQHGYEATTVAFPLQ